MRKKVLLIPLVLLAVSLIGCSTPPPSTSPPPVTTTPETTTTPTAEKVADDIEAVRNSITANLKEGLEYQAGSLQGGTAVLINDLGAYWVKDGVVYAANGTAKTWSSNIDYAPVGIDFDSVKGAVDASHPTTAPPTITPPKPQTFEPITITGSSDKKSPPFTVTTEEWIIDWSFVPDREYPEMAIFGFFVYPRGETVMFVESVLFPEGISGSTYSYAGPGEYYIDVTVANVERWEVTIRPAERS